MKKSITLILISIFLLAGCVTPHYQYFNIPSNSNSAIKGVHYQVWYPEEFKSHFIKQKEGSKAWIVTEKYAVRGIYLLDFYLLLGSEEDLTGFMILKVKQKISLSRTLRAFKKLPEITLFESDQRIVNGRLTVWISGLVKNAHFSSYFINSDTGARIFAFFLSPEDHRKHEKLIRAVLNGVVVN